MHTRDRQELWAVSYAFSSFQNARDTCKLLLRYCLTNKDELFAPLATAFHAQYMRPFMKVDGIDESFRLSRDNVPSALRAMHDFVAKFRHKVLIHSDSTARIDSGEFLNDVRLVRTSDDLLISLADSRAVIETYNPLIGLADGMSLEMGKRLVHLLGVHQTEIPHDLGSYVLNLDGSQAFTKQKEA